MVQKRPYDDEEIFKISFKHPRQVEHSKQLISFSESVFSEDASGIPQNLGEQVLVSIYTYLKCLKWENIYGAHLD